MPRRARAHRWLTWATRWIAAFAYDGPAVVNVLTDPDDAYPRTTSLGVRLPVGRAGTRTRATRSSSWTSCSGMWKPSPEPSLTVRSTVAVSPLRSTENDVDTDVVTIVDHECSEGIDEAVGTGAVAQAV